MLDGFDLDLVSGVRDEAGKIYVWDGKLRSEAARQAGLQLSVSITAGTQLDAEWLAASANQRHGLHRTSRDKRFAVKLALLHPYGVNQSNRSLARHCGVVHKTVASVRRELEEDGDIPVITNRVAQRSNGATYQIDTTSLGATPKQLYDLPEMVIDDVTIEQAVRFTPGETWNPNPTQKCLNNTIDFQSLREAIAAGNVEFIPKPDGSVAQFCPHLRLFPQYIEQVIPQRDVHQPEKFLDQIDCFCANLQVKKPNSCFNDQEQIAIEAAMTELKVSGLSVISRDEVKALKKDGQFIWLGPQLKGISCTPEICVHTNNNPSGFSVIPEPDGSFQMVCRHAECGSTAQQSLIDHEAEQQHAAARQQKEAIDQLRQTTVEKTLFGKLDLSAPEVMEVLESILVPEWDTATMEHVVIGWQRAMVAQLVVELDCTDAQMEFKTRYGMLRQIPTFDINLLCCVNKSSILTRTGRVGWRVWQWQRPGGKIDLYPTDQ